MAASVEIVREALSQALSEVGVDIEEVQIQVAGRREIVRVVVDKDGGVDLDLVADVSRRIAELLDAEPLADQFAATYVLEVSSPGTDRPLTEPKHWRRAASRLVEVVLIDGTSVEGRIMSADDREVAIELPDGHVRAIPMSGIAKGLVQVEFTHHGGTASGDSVGDDLTLGDDLTNDEDVATGDEE